MWFVEMGDVRDVILKGNVYYVVIISIWLMVFVKIVRLVIVNIAHRIVCTNANNATKTII